MNELDRKQTLFLEMGALFHEARQYLDGQFKAFNLTRLEWLTLALLRTHKGEINQAFAKAYLGIEISYFTKILNQLEKKGFIIRKIDPHDRRNRIITLNPTAAGKLRKIFAIIHSLNETMLSELNKEQIQTMHDYLVIIRQQLSLFKTQQ